MCVGYCGLLCYSDVSRSGGSDSPIANVVDKLSIKLSQDRRSNQRPLSQSVAGQVSCGHRPPIRDRRHPRSFCDVPPIRPVVYIQSAEKNLTAHARFPRAVGSARSGPRPGKGPLKKGQRLARYPTTAHAQVPRAVSVEASGWSAMLPLRMHKSAESAVSRPPCHLSSLSPGSAFIYLQLIFLSRLINTPGQAGDIYTVA